ncbi:exopolysaccharide Pel transporter PelG [Oribacterium sp. WCC10]|uniref:exopolysaccharide Pel transporter PelG n=1 Tax=Oribacterium sp. WCC10 TaxID=1855343 RepID=UPI0008DF2C60|nr:exopolysaccharide Pel transporter PelG [Oribacterium sp. WCC10]SFG26202.1 Uncharacterized membrane protein [Oribacterium sp. WCC10]
MAGIGFSLKKLFDKKGIMNLCKAYGYAGIVTIGPMILGVALLAGVSMLAQISGLSEHDRELLNCMLTYSLLVALLVTTFFNMVVTRYVSDMIYQGRNTGIMPSFYGVSVIELVICAVIYTPFLIISSENAVQCILCLWLAMVLIIVWTEMIYLTAIKDFNSIVLSFTISLMFGFLVALIFVLMGKGSVESFLSCVILSYGILAVRQQKLLLDYFPKSRGSNFSFLKYFDKFPTLALSGALIRIGLFGHLIVMYFGPLRVQVSGGFYGAPEYDVPALVSFFSLLITTISFVISVEVNFYPKYSDYYGLFASKGAIKDIKLAEKEMLDVMERELIYLGCKQLFTTVLFVVIGAPVMKYLFPGISSLSLAIYKFLCVGYGVYAIANSIMLIQLYFADYEGAFTGTVLFSLVSTGATLWQILYGDVQFFGAGFFIGALAFYFYSLVRLNWYTKRLSYFLLARQQLIENEKCGIFTEISRKLDERIRKKEEKIRRDKETAAEKSLQKEGMRH